MENIKNNALLSLVQKPLFVKGYGFLSFAKNIGKNISRTLGMKYGQKCLDQKSAINALKT